MIPFQDLFIYFFYRYRKHSGPDHGPRFGINLEVTRTGLISVGDSVYIARKEETH